jgi:phenylpropionate dioxygenase-like ring-hydroxylating dioxygenase large terminal subunit
VWIWVSRSGLAPTYSVPAIPELEGQTLKTGGDIGFTYQTHYTRTVENGIDPTHAAFVHGKSIGKVDPNTDFSLEPYELQENPNDFHARMPIKVKKINGLTRFLLRGDASSLYKEYRFIYPNLVVSTVHFGRFELSALQAHVPETAGRTTVRVTNTRNFLRRTPLLSQWFDRVTASTGVKISSEDAEVITDQLPLQVKFKGSHEVLVRSDNILSAYRRWMSARLRADITVTGQA